MRVLFCTTRGAGHLLPLVPFAKTFMLGGHDVLMAGPASAAPLAARSRVPFRPLGEPSPTAIAAFRAGQARLSAEAAAARAVPELFVRLHAKAALPDLLRVLEEWRPDVILRETAEYASLVAAERYGVPHVEVSIALSVQLAERMAPLAALPLAELRDSAGLEPSASAAANGPVLTMAPESLEGPKRPSGRVHRFRRTDALDEQPLAPWGDPEAPLVVVAFGTEVPSPSRPYFPGLYRSVVEQLAGLPIRVLVAVGDERDPGALRPLPASVRVERFIPQAAVLRAAPVSVSHGGAGSTLLALAAGVPLAVLPFFADQPFNARLVAEVGAGIALDGGPAGLGATVGTLLEDPQYGRSARRVSAEVAALPPVAEAIGVVAAVAGA